MTDVMQPWFLVLEKIAASTLHVPEWTIDLWSDFSSMNIFFLKEKLSRLDKHCEQMEEVSAMSRLGTRFSIFLQMNTLTVQYSGDLRV